MSLSVRIALLLLALAVPLRAQQPPAATRPPAAARVVRVAPERILPVDGIITVTFDRPVVGSLEQTGIDPSSVLAIEPAVRGEIEWRDPITLRFRPAEPFRPGVRYTIRIAARTAAGESSPGIEPFSRELLGDRPRVLGVFFADPHFLAPVPRIQVLWSARPDSSAVASLGRIEFDRQCAGPRHTRLRVVDRRPVLDTDSYNVISAAAREAWALRFREIVELEPLEPLPLRCKGVVVVRRPPGAAADSIVVQISTRDTLRLNGVVCAQGGKDCPRGGLLVQFSTPVLRAEVQRHLRLSPAVPFELPEYGGASTQWPIPARLSTSTTYRIEIDSGMRDVFDQRIAGERTRELRTDAIPDTVVLPRSDLYVPLGVEPVIRVRSGRAPLLPVTVTHVPAAWASEWLVNPDARARASELAALRRERRVSVDVQRDSAAVTDVRIPLDDLHVPGLTLAAISGRDVRIQRTGLAVHARLGERGGAVLVTGMTDARPRAGAAVHVFDRSGRELARGQTDAAGVARLAIDNTRIDSASLRPWFRSFDGSVLVASGADRAVLALTDSNPLARPGMRAIGSFGYYGYHHPGESRGTTLLAGTVMTERGIYRSGETLYVTGVVRAGVLGALVVPSSPDSLRWRLARPWTDDEPIVRPVALSPFGTFADSLRLAPTMPLDDYEVVLERKVRDEWTALGETAIRVAEYRPPAFLVSIEEVRDRILGEDPIGGTVRGSYLFGAPMAGARVRWTAFLRPVPGYALRIPEHEQFAFGDNTGRTSGGDAAVASDSAVLGAEGSFRIVVPAGSLRGVTHRMSLHAGVIDVDRQEISSESHALLHPAAHHVGGKTSLWLTGREATIEIVAVTPEGERIAGAPVRVVVLRPRRPSEWAHAANDTVPRDTVGSCAITSALEPVSCRITPRTQGLHEVLLETRDSAGRESTTSFGVWAVGRRWASAPDEPHLLRLTTDRTDYAPSDTIELAFTSPFPRATAWITVEREVILASEVRQVGEGIVRHRLVVPAGWAPNAYVSVMLIAPVPDTTVAAHPRPLVLAGHVAVNVAPLGQRLTVDVTPRSSRADAGDSVHVDVQVTDAHGRGTRSELALWAADEGILSLTGFETPDPVAGLYRARSRGPRDASTQALIAREPPPLEFYREPRVLGFGGPLRLSEVVETSVSVARDGPGGGDLPRSAFRATAFFLARIRTDARGHASVSARLPDNLTTFRIIAIAVAEGDAYGSGISRLTVTRPLIARPALPRFVRPGDVFSAGAVVHRESHEPATVRLDAEASGIELTGTTTRRVEVRDGIGVEGRFDFRARRGDTVMIRVRADDGSARDVVDTRLAVRPDFHPRWHTVTGVARDSATVEITLPPGTDPARSRLVIAATSSPAAVIRRAAAWFDVYPYACTEQLVSAGVARVALARAERAAGAPVTLDREKLQSIIDLIIRRQRPDGGFGYWNRESWSTPWLSAYAGLFLLDARELGASVPAHALDRLAHHLRSLFETSVDEAPNGAWWLIDPRARMSDRVAAMDFLQRASRFDRRHLYAVLVLAPRMAWEDRVRLAEVLARGEQPLDSQAATRLLREAWTVAAVAGNRVVLPDTLSHGTLFPSPVRPAARLFSATMAVEPTHPLLGPLAELLMVGGRANRRFVWSTQDWSSAVAALATFDAGQRAARSRPVSIRTGARELATLASDRDSASIPLIPVLVPGTPGDSVRVRVGLHAAAGTPVWFHAGVEEVPLEPPVTPDLSGIVVERWYERTSDGTPVTELLEGELVRVRLRITVPGDRYFVLIDDPLPAGLEVVDLGLRTSASVGTLDAARRRPPSGGGIDDRDPSSPWAQSWLYGDWSHGWWSPWDHREYRDDRVIFSASMLWSGTYSASYLARATTSGVFVRPPVHAEEMYNPGVHGRSDGGKFTVRTPER